MVKQVITSAATDITAVAAYIEETSHVGGGAE